MADGVYREAGRRGITEASHASFTGKGPPGTARIRLEVTAVLEYEVRFRDYDTTDVDEILRMDVETAEEDAMMFLSNEDTKWSFRAEVVPDG